MNVQQRVPRGQPKHLRDMQCLCSTIVEEFPQMSVMLPHNLFIKIRNLTGMFRAGEIQHERPLDDGHFQNHEGKLKGTRAVILLLPSSPTANSETIIA